MTLRYSARRRLTAIFIYMIDKIILICATGRSGSTTIQRIINTIPNSNMCGENLGAINDLLKFYLNIKTATLHYIPNNKNDSDYNSLIESGIKPSWYNSYNYDEIKNEVKLLIAKMFKKSQETTLWGFKENRWGEWQDPYYNGKVPLVAAFKELFPQTKVIINISEDVDKQSDSGRWSAKHGGKERAKNYLSKLNSQLLKFYGDNKNYCYLFTFEKILNLNSIKNMFNFIGCQDSYDEEKIKKVLCDRLKFFKPHYN